MELALPALLSLLQSVIPALGTTTAIGKIIAVLSALAPVLVKEYKDVKPIITSIINSLSSHPKTLPEQRAELDAMSAKYDAEFEAAAKAAEEEDAAAAALEAAMGKL